MAAGADMVPGRDSLWRGGARGAAAALVLGVTDAGLALSDPALAAALARLSASDRARAGRLALATLRHVAAADATLKPLLRKGPPPAIRAILRTATVELMQEGGDGHGVVNAAVTLAQSAGPQARGFAGLVNAVLRKVAGLPRDAWAAHPPQAMPGWLRGRVMSAYGSAAARAIEAAHARGAAMDLTPRDGNAPALAARLGGTVLPTGSVRLPSQPGAVSDLPGYDSGDWWVQDAAAALPARAAQVRPGETALDLCAAPGGKTLQLAAAGAEVTALDLSPARMDRLAENLTRCQLTARTVTADALTWDAPQAYDLVLLDAPCSATGTIRRHPDLPFIRDAASLKPLVALQAALLDRALAHVAPGGRLVFATCSLLPEEGERQVAAALQRHPGLATDPDAPAALPGIDPAWITPEGGLRLRADFWPETGGMDGFYLAVLRPSA
jgi:16S rRNA (cytosine967-C5)-methyltransferase